MRSPRRARENELDVAFPRRGPCGICGRGWARHRECDAIRSQVRAGDSIEAVARWFDYPIEAVRLLVGLNGAAYGWWLRSEGRAPASDERSEEAT